MLASGSSSAPSHVLASGSSGILIYKLAALRVPRILINAAHSDTLGFRLKLLLISARLKVFLNYVRTVITENPKPVIAFLTAVI